MSRKEMFESQIHAELAIARRRAPIVLLSPANNLKRLGSLFPFQRFAFEGPQVPLRVHNVSSVFVNILSRDGRDFRCAKNRFAEIPFRNWALGRIDCLNG